MSICINPFNCPLKKCNKVHHFKRKFKTTLNLCENFNQCNDYHNCIKYHPERPIFNEKISYTDKINNLELLPKDLFLNISMYLDFKDINNIYKTSKNFDFIFYLIKNPLKIKFIKNIKNYLIDCKIINYKFSNNLLKIYDESKSYSFKNIYDYYNFFEWDNNLNIPKKLNDNSIFIGYKNITRYYPKKNEIVDVMDNEGVWYEAKIIKEYDDSYLVHFLSWENKWNIKIKKNSFNIAKLHTFTPNWRQNININDYIDVKIKNLWYCGIVSKKVLNKIWITIENRQFSICKMNINDENIALFKTHTKIFNFKNNNLPYRIKYFCTNILYCKLNNGSIPLYLNKYDNFYTLE